MRAQDALVESARGIDDAMWVFLKTMEARLPLFSRLSEEEDCFFSLKPIVGCRGREPLHS